jgi:hypothetical protein
VGTRSTRNKSVGMRHEEWQSCENKESRGKDNIAALF